MGHAKNAWSRQMAMPKKNTWAKGMAMLKTHGLMACHVNFNKRAGDVIFEGENGFGSSWGDLGRF